MVECSDDELVLQVKRTGSRDAFGELVLRHQGAVRSTLMRLTKNPHATDDLAQDTFVRAFDRINQYVLGKSFRAWLGGIAYNEHLQRLRKQGTSRRHLQNLAVEREDAGVSAHANSVAVDLDQALEKLRSEERNAVVLSYGFGMSHVEIASVMHAPLGTVKSWVNRGKDKLRGSLESYSSAKTND
jgi:RNA polymerase sigma-70 factor (ECF subfamily)